jgi:DNA-binding transcriptional LysR family regulator
MLFERTTRRVALTPAGRRLLADTAALQAVWNRIDGGVAALDPDTGTHRDAVAEEEHPEPSLPGRLRLTAASLPAVRLLEALTDAYPGTGWHHEPFDHARSLVAVGAGELDLAIVFQTVHSARSTPTPEVTTAAGTLPAIHLVDEPVWLATGCRTTWAEHEELALRQLATESWIARSDGPLRELFDTACHSAGFTPVELHVVDNNWPIRTLVASGRAVTLCAATVAGEDVVVVPLVDPPRLRYQLVWSPRRLTDIQARHIHRTLVSWYRTEAQRSRRYWAHILSHPGDFPTLQPSPVTGQSCVGSSPAAPDEPMQPGSW